MNAMFASRLLNLKLTDEGQIAAWRTVPNVGCPFLVCVVHIEAPSNHCRADGWTNKNRQLVKVERNGACAGAWCKSQCMHSHATVAIVIGVGCRRTAGCLFVLFGHVRQTLLIDCGCTKAYDRHRTRMHTLENGDTTPQPYNQEGHH